MGKRLTVALITGFWLVMAVLLCWQEFGGGRPLGSKVPSALVWGKILTAPDQSMLEIRQGTNHIGFCRWRPDIGQEYATGARMVEEEDEILEDMARQLAYYTLDVDGNLDLPHLGHRARFVLGAKLDTNRLWQDFHARVTVRPDVYEVTASAAQQTVRIHVNAGGDTLDRTLRWADFQNPQKLLLELGGPAFPLVLGALGVAVPPSAAGTNLAQSLGIKWDACNGSLLIGHNNVRAYRLTGTVLDRFTATFYVSPVGEILRVELPGKILLLNNALAALQPAP